MTAKRPAPDTKQLLDHADFLRSLARALIGDEHDAEDIVQETYLAALTGHHHRGHQWRAWLRTVARNLAWKRRRSEIRRSRRERACAQAEPMPSAVDLAVRVELHQRLAQAVADLEEPYRSTIVLRFFYELDVAQIARRESVTAAAVRTRLRRAREHLRARLDRDYGGNRRAWVLPAMPLATTLAKTSPASGLIGALAMKSKLIWIVALFTCLCVYFVWDVLSQDERQRAEITPPSTGSALGEIVSGPPHKDREQSDSIARPTAQAGVLLKGKVTLESGTVGESVELELRGQDYSGAWTEGWLRATIPSGERFRVDVGSLFADGLPIALRIVARHAEHVAQTERHPVAIDAVNGRPRLEDLEITLGRGGTLRGAVRGPDGVGAPNVTVAAYRIVGEVPDETAAASVVTKVHGRYRLDVVENGTYLVVAVATSYRPAADVVAVRVGQILDIPPLVLQIGETITGRVTRTGGLAVPRAQVTATLLEPGLFLLVPGTETHLSWTRSNVEHGIVSVTANREGHYRLGGLHATGYQIAVAKVERTHYGVFRAPSGPRYAQETTAPATGVDFELEVATLQVIVRHSGEGLENASVSVTDTRADSEYDWIYSTRQDGRLTVRVRSDATCVLEATAQGFVRERKTVRTPKAGGSVTMVFDLARETPKATLVVVMRATGEKPLPPLPPIYSFELTPAAGGQAKHLAALAQGTRYVLRNLDPGDYHLVARAEGHDTREGGYYLAAKSRVHLTAGGTTESVLRIRPGGRIKVIVRTPEGRTDVVADAWLETLNKRRVDLAFIKYGENRSMVSAGRLPPLQGPAYGRKVLRSGVYRLQVRPHDEQYRPRAVEVRVAAGTTTAVVIDVER